MFKSLKATVLAKDHARIVRDLLRNKATDAVDSGGVISDSLAHAISSATDRFLWAADNVVRHIHRW